MLVRTPLPERQSLCSGCYRPIYWCETVKGQRAPMDQIVPLQGEAPPGLVSIANLSHFGTCPKASHFVKDKRRITNGL